MSKISEMLRIQGTPADKFNNNLQSNSSWILRIQGIPIDKSKDDLKHDLDSAIRADQVLVAGRTTVIQLTLVPRDPKSACACVTFDTSLSCQVLINRLCKIGVGYEYDRDFLGMTPLFESEGGGNVE
jgi:hypothetical protein